MDKEMREIVERLIDWHGDDLIEEFIKRMNPKEAASILYELDAEIETVHTEPDMAYEEWDDRRNQ